MLTLNREDHLLWKRMKGREMKERIVVVVFFSFSPSPIDLGRHFSFPPL